MRPSTTHFRSHVTRASGFLLSFGLGKVAIYCVPLAVAAIASPKIYGSVEVAYAATLLVATALISAPLHGLSHRYLVFRKTQVQDQAALLILGANLVGLTAFAVALRVGIGEERLLILAVSGITSAQIVLSFLMRIKNRSAILAWTDGLVLLLGAAIVGFAHLALGGATLPILIGGYVAASLLAIAASLYVLLRDRALHLRQRLVENAHQGLWMAVAAMFGAWIAVSGRIVVGFTAPDDLPAFGVAFRIAGLAVGVQQLVQTALWSRIYTARTRVADRLLAVSVAATAAIVALISLFGGLIISNVRFEALDRDAVLLSQQLLAPVSLQILFWMAQVMLQSRVNRLGATRAALLPLAIVSVIGLLCILAAYAAHSPTILIVWLLAAYSAVYFCTTWTVLARRGFPHVLVLRTAVIAGVSLALLSLR